MVLAFWAFRGGCCRDLRESKEAMLRMDNVLRHVITSLRLDGACHIVDEAGFRPAAAVLEAFGMFLLRSVV